MNKLENYFQYRGRHYEMSNGWNQIKNYDTRNLKIAVSVLKNRVIELKGKIRD